MFNVCNVEVYNDDKNAYPLNSLTADNVDNMPTLNAVDELITLWGNALDI